MPWARTRNFLVSETDPPPKKPPPIELSLSNAPATPGRGTGICTEVSRPPTSKCRFLPVGLVSNATLVEMSGIRFATPAVTEPSTEVQKALFAPKNAGHVTPGAICCGLATDNAQPKWSVGFQAMRNCASREYITPVMMLPSVAIVVSRSEGEAPTPTLFGVSKPQACPRVNSKLPRPNCR